MPTRLLLVALCAVLALPAAALAISPNPNANPNAGGGTSENTGDGGQPIYQVSGGGQVLLGSNGGAGDTVAFVAQLLDDTDSAAARGQFRYIDRGETGTGQGQQRRFGTVTCVVPDAGGNGDDNETGPATARFGGELRDGGSFLVDVVDFGAPGQAAEGFGAALRIQWGDDDSGYSECDDDEFETGDDLARGNVTIHDRRNNDAQ